MSVKYHPSVDIAVIIEALKNCPNVIEVFKTGATTCYVLKGSRPIHERLCVIKENSIGEVDFELAMGIAIKLKCVPIITDWLEKHKNWKEGEYFVRKPSKEEELN